MSMAPKWEVALFGLPAFSFQLPKPYLVRRTLRQTQGIFHASALSQATLTELDLL